MEHKDLKQVFWLASYPKSGNTWIRHIMTYLFFDIHDREKVGIQISKNCPDIHELKSNITKVPSVSFLDKNISFVKTHSCGKIDIFKNINTMGFIYIFRHPLDVLISSINHAYIKERNHFFHDKRLHSVEELKNTSQLDIYINSFMKDLNIDLFMDMSDSWINNVQSWIELSKSYQDRSIIFKYEKLIDDPVCEFQKLKNIFPVTEKSVVNAIEFANKHTNDGGKFFWKKKSNTHQEYFNPMLVDEFYSKYSCLLEKLDYL